jgi:hypothetical protein
MRPDTNRFRQVWIKMPSRWRRRSLPADKLHDQPVPGASAQATIDPLEPDWNLLGVVTADLVLRWRDWIMRRVETLTFVDGVTLRREVSVDFTVPPWLEPSIGLDAGGIHYLPITRLRKRTLTNFDLTDEGNRSLPLLTSLQHTALSAHALIAVAAAALDAEPSAELRTRCEHLVGWGNDSRLAYEWLYEQSEGQDNERSRLLKDETFVLLTEVLRRSSILYVAVPAQAGIRRIVKFSYDETVHDPDLTWGETLARGFGWRGKEVWIPLPALGDVPSFHLEVAAPDGLQIRRRKLVYLDAAGVPRIETTPGSYSRARFSLKPMPGFVGLGLVQLRPRSTTIVRAALLTALLSLVLLVSTEVANLLGAFSEKRPVSPALLLFAPGVLSLYISRAGEHPMATDMLLGIRALAWTPGLLAFAAAWVLSAGGQDLWAHVAAGALCIGALAVAAILTVSWLTARTPRDLRTPGDEA